MRDYGKVAPQFWTGDTGKKLKAAGPAAVVVAMYLMTSPHANMIGLYYLPKMYIAHETGLGMEGASEGLARAIEAGFCTYDEASEHVFVHTMVRFQIAESLKADDKRCKGVENELSKAPKGALQEAFREMHGEAFHLPEAQKGKGHGRPSEAPTKPRAGARAGTSSGAGESDPPSPSGSRLPADWALPAEWRDWATAERRDLNIAREADVFRDHWHAKPGKDGRKADWEATWRNWIRRAGAGQFRGAPADQSNSPAARRAL